MHDGVQYDPIHGQGQSQEPFIVRNMAFLTAISSAIYNWELETDHGFLN